jgi:hypothetical protein
MIKRLQTKANKINQFQFLKFKLGDVVAVVTAAATTCPIYTAAWWKP